MTQTAQVTSIDSLKDLYAALCTFKAEAMEALNSIDMEIRKVHDWIDDQQRYWKKEAHERHEELFQAKMELNRRKNWRILDKPPDCTEQEQAFHLAGERLEEAEGKGENCRRWSPQFQRAVEEYESPTRQFSMFLDCDIPRAIALLAGKIASLEHYATLAGVSRSSPSPVANQPAPAGQGQDSQPQAKESSQEKDPEGNP